MSTLLVCSVGGHLAQLHRLAPHLDGIDERRVWVTFDTPQSRSLLHGETVVYLEYTGPRDIKNVIRHTLAAQRLLGEGHRFSSVVSTGSGIALSFLPLARAHGLDSHYIESFTRSTGPSLTGRVLARTPGIRLYSQHPSWAAGRWRYRGSVFDTFSTGPTQGAPASIRRAVVTLGTMRHYPFAALVKAAYAALPADAEVLWQLGCTEVPGLPIRAREFVPGKELSAAIRAADVVIAHAGCGSAVTALQEGKVPVLAPRRAAAGENVDDHQRLLAEELAGRGLAVVRDARELTGADLLEAAARSATTAGAARFRLQAR